MNATDGQANALLTSVSTMKQPRTQEHNNHPVSFLYRHAPRVIVLRSTFLERHGLTPRDLAYMAMVIAAVTLAF